MMAKLSSMYGTDDNAMASSIASAALGDPSSNAHSGNPIDQSAKSKGASGNGEVSENGDATITKHGIGNDKRAHTKGNHGEQD